MVYKESQMISKNYALQMTVKNVQLKTAISVTKLDTIICNNKHVHIQYKICHFYEP